MESRYVARVQELSTEVSELHDDLNLRAERDDDISIPTMAFSEFLINKEQGDWAEAYVNAILNEHLDEGRALEYGRAQDKVAGDPGFEEYYRAYHEELDEIGKCPDVLLYDASDVTEELSTRIESIESVPRNEVVGEARDAVAGLEIRSSSFLAGEYREHNEEQRMEHEARIAELWESIESLSDEVLRSKSLEDPTRWKEFIAKVRQYSNAESKAEAPRFVTSSKIKRMAREELRADDAETFLDDVDALRSRRKKTFGRDFLSFTPKVEDLIVIRTWIETHGVPHYYVQVFFDEIHVISFEDILELLADESKHGEAYYFEQNQKNQLKNTIHIDIAEGERIASGAPMPETSSNHKILPKGRVLHYISFETVQTALDESVVDVGRLPAVFGFD